MEVAKVEKERLKQQQQHKKQLIEKMRAESNAMAEAGEVRFATAPIACCCCCSVSTSLGLGA